MLHRMHSPLIYNYRSHKPLTTLYWLLDRPWWYHALTMVAYGIKYTPALLHPIYMGLIINGLAKGEFIFFGTWWFIPLFVFLFLQNIPTNFLFMELLSSATRRLEQNLRGAIARRLQQLEIAFHDRTESGRLQSKMLRDVDQVYNLSHYMLSTIPHLVINLGFALIWTAMDQPFMLLFYLVLIPMGIAIQRGFQAPMTKRNEAYRGEFEAMSAKVAEMVELIPVTRAHGVETKEVQDVDKHLDTVHKQGRKLDVVNIYFGSIVWVGMMLLRVACVGTCLYLCYKTQDSPADKQLNPGDIYVYLCFYDILKGTIEGFLNMLPTLTRSFESIRSIGEVLECPDIEANEGKDIVESVDGRITFENVSFQYPEADAFAVKDFSIDIAPGECVAFVGESGGGKSTLMSLVIGFHRATQGRLLLDGTDMQTIDMREFRNHIAVVPQRTILFAGTIRQNILHGLEQKVEEDRLREVIEAANVAQFTDKLPDGLETVIGERGAKISGGQQQRISIARALIRDPEIILLDEATSALDVISEALVQEAINRLVEDRTTLIVAHRLSTVRKADRIVVMKGGECIELGTPTELLEAGGEFARLHNLQQMLL